MERLRHRGAKEMTELSFLLDLLLNDKLSIIVKRKLTDRIKEIELRMIPSSVSVVPKMAQAPSTQKILDEMAMHPLPTDPPQPQNAATAQALNSRQEAIRIAASGKPEVNRSSPRKF